jgi:hypothetical protein
VTGERRERDGGPGEAEESPISYPIREQFTLYRVESATDWGENNANLLAIIGDLDT